MHSPERPEPAALITPLTRRSLLKGMAVAGAGIAIAELSGGTAVAATIVTIAIVGAAAITAFTAPRSWTSEP